MIEFHIENINYFSKFDIESQIVQARYNGILFQDFIVTFLNNLQFKN